MLNKEENNITKIELKYKIQSVSLPQASLKPTLWGVLSLPPGTQSFPRYLHKAMLQVQVDIIEAFAAFGYIGAIAWHINIIIIS